MKETISVNNKRNYGIDLLRIVSMFMVVLLHIMGHGGILQSTNKLSAQYEVAWAVEIFCYCAVNCYALISGYVGVNSKFKLTNIANIWLQVVFYAVILTGIGAYLSPNIPISDALKGFAPVSNDIYWYFTAYFCLFFFTPVLNAAINTLNINQLKFVGISLSALLSVIPLISGKDIFYTYNGYSAFWLMALYLLGAIIRKTDFLGKLKKRVLLLLYLFVVLITWAEKYIVDYLNLNFPGAEARKTVLLSYTSPTIVLAAVFLIVLFSKINTKITWEKVISFIAPLTFGVYLIHETPFIRKTFITNRFSSLAFKTPLEMFAFILLSGVMIFAFCLVVEYLRNQLFKALKVKSLLQTVEGKINPQKN